MQEPIWKRVKLIDLAGCGGVTPFPWWYRLGSESLYEIAQRPLDIIRKADSFLMQAPVHGWNPTWLLGSHSGIVLFSCSCQVSELENFLTFPEQWENRLQQVEKEVPEARESVAFFRNEYSKWSKDRRISRSEALRIKAATFTLSPETKAMFGMSSPRIDINEVIEKRQCILIDGSGITDIARRRFLLMYLISYISSFLKARGPGHDHPPFSLAVDEFSLATNFQSSDDLSFEQDLDELLNVLSRSHRLWLTLASQTIGQYSEGIQRSLLSMGTQMFGRISDMESAEKIAKWFGDLDPWKVKAERLVSAGRFTALSTPIYLPLAEQTFLEAKKLQTLPKFTFLIRPALAEGTVAKEMLRVNIRNFDAGRYVDPILISKAKDILRKRSGIPVATILKEIATRLPQTPPSSSLRILPSYEKPRHFILPDADPEEDIR